jgi:hypothetical protein
MSKTINKVRGIVIFYRGILIPSFLVTIFCCILTVVLSVNLLKNHEPFFGIIVFFPQSLWTKVITDFFIVLYLLKFRSNEFYFYYNLGIRKSRLWFYTFALDFLVFITCFCCSGLIVRLIHI